MATLVVAVLAACANRPESTAGPAAVDPPAIPTDTGLPAPSSTPNGSTAPPTLVLQKRTAKNVYPDRGPDTTGGLYQYPDPPERDLYRLAAQLKPDMPHDIPRVVNDQPVYYKRGRVDTFWLLDLSSLEYYQATFDLRLVTPHAYWYVDQRQEVQQEDLEKSAQEFEEVIYPGVTSIFGSEWFPGVDNDSHLNILNSRLRGVGGYFSSGDEYPLQISPFSNQREIIYMNIGAFPVGTERYLGVLAHELQHAVHWNADASEDTWVNEGLSDFSVARLGYGNASAQAFLRSRPTSMVHWPVFGGGSQANYGAAAMFMQYLVEHYGDPDDLRPLINRPEDGIRGIDVYLKDRGHPNTFREVFQDWIVANFLDQFLPDEDGGRFSYSGLSVGILPTQTLDSPSTLESELPQFSAEYIRVNAGPDPIRIVFQSPTHVPLLPTEVGAEGCWWSNVGDSIDSRLTRPLDLSDTPDATLSYEVWYELETDWDYAYLQVSTDDGETWEILETAHTSSTDPLGNSFGPGYTGESNEWLLETIDLSEYSGQRVLLRFQYITDDAINGSGLCLRGFSGSAAANWREAWQAEGFVLVDNLTAQQFSVRIIQVGTENRVTDLELDSQNSGVVSIESPGDSEMLVVAVGAMAAKTQQKASYTLTVEPAE